MTLVSTRRPAVRPAFELLEARILLSDSHSFEVIARTGDSTADGKAITGFKEEVSINDAGTVAFVAYLDSGSAVGRSVVVGDASSSPVQIAFGPHTTRGYLFPQINNAGSVVALEWMSGNPVLMVDRVWDASHPGSCSKVATNYDPFGYPYYNFVGLPTIANDGGVAFVAEPSDMSGQGLYVSATGEQWTEQWVFGVPSGNPRPMAADGGTVVVEEGGRIVLCRVGGGPVGIASAATGFSDLGRSPGITDDGSTVAFRGEDSNGPGIFVSIASPAGRVVRRVAGVSGNGVLDPGETWSDENSNDRVDPGEDNGPVAGFDTAQRVGVNCLSPGVPNTLAVVYLATGSDGVEGVYFTSVDMSDADQPSVTAAKPVVRTGDTIEGLPGAVENLALYDPVNATGSVALFVRLSGGTEAVVRAQLAQDTELTHPDFEALARDNAYEDWAEGQQMMIGGHLLQVDEVFEDTDGFYAVGLISDTCEPVLVIRGTSVTELGDIWTDVDPNGVGYAQFAANYVDVRDWLLLQEQDGHMVDVTGHSLGGSLAQWIACAWTHESHMIGEVVTFNATGISNSRDGYPGLDVYADQFVPALSDGATHYIVDGDIVSMAGERFIEGTWQRASFRDLNLLDKHLCPILIDSARGVSRPSDLVLEPQGSTAALNEPSYVHGDWDYWFWLGAAEILTITTPGLQRFASIPLALKARISTEELRREIGAGWQEVTAVLDPSTNEDVVECLLPDVDFTLLGLLQVQASDLSLRYEQGPSRVFRIQGMLRLPAIFNATADFAGENYIEVKERGGDHQWEWKVVGTLSVEDIVIVPGVWEVKSAELSFNTLANEVKGTATLRIPPGIELSAELGFLDGRLNEAALGLDDLSIPIGTTGAYLQAIRGGVDHLADAQAILFRGGVGVTAGPEVSVSLPSWAGGDFTGSLLRLDCDGAIDANHLDVSGDVSIAGGIVSAIGNVELNWDRRFLAGQVHFNALGGLVEADSSFRTDSKLDIAMAGTGRVAVPKAIPLIGGWEVASGNVRLEFINDGIPANDFVAAWATFSLPFVGDWRGGFIVYFDGRSGPLGGKEMERLQPLSPLDFDEAETRSGTEETGWFMVDSATQWVMLSAEWENPASAAAIALKMPTGVVLGEAEIAADPNMSVVAELSSDCRKVVLVRSPAVGQWGISLADTTGLGEVAFYGMMASVAPTVSIMGVADGVRETPIQIDVEAYDADSDAVVSLFYDTDDTGFDGVLIASGLAETDGAISYDWDAIGAPAGEYRLYASAMDENNPSVVSEYFADPVIVALPGDANFDDAVDHLDYLNWKLNVGMQGEATWADGDCTGDGIVGREDLVVIAENLNRDVNPPAAPDAATNSLLPQTHGPAMAAACSVHELIVVAGPRAIGQGGSQAVKLAARGEPSLMDPLLLVAPSVPIWRAEGIGAAAGDVGTTDSWLAACAQEAILAETTSGGEVEEELGTPLVDALSLPNLMVVGSSY